MKERVVQFWHKIDGPIGALLIAMSCGMTGYVIRGYEDGGIVATLIERVQSSRLDERVQQRFVCTRLSLEWQERAKLRDSQVDLLIKQNEYLIRLVSRDSITRNTQLAKLKEATEQATRSANAAESAANASEQKSNEVSQKLESATQPIALPPKPWTGGGRNK